MLQYHYYPTEQQSNAHTLILLHGIGGNSNIFYKQIDAFKAHFNVLCIDLPGHGNSPHVDAYERCFSFDVVVEEIERTMEDLHIQRAHFVGISLGSIVIHHLLQRAPERVMSAVLGGTITRFDPFSKTLLAIGQRIKRFTPHIWVYKLFAQIMMPKANHQTSRRFFIQEAKKMSRHNFFTWFTLIQNVKETYKHVQQMGAAVPKLYISGDEDHLFVKGLLEDIKQDVQASAVILERCGHICNIERAQEFNEAALQFIRKHALWHNDETYAVAK